MPPSGLCSRNLAIGESSPSGSSSSILVLGSVMKTVVTPWSGCGTAAGDFRAQRIAIDRRRLGDVAHRDGDVIETTDHGFTANAKESRRPLHSSRLPA